MRMIERTMLDLAALAVVALCVVITANVVGRAMGGNGVPDAIILVRELMIATILLPLAAATANRAHVAVTFLTDMFSPRVRGTLMVMGWIFAMIGTLPILYAGWRALGHAFASGEFYQGDLDLPRWPGYAVFVFGLAAMWLRLGQVALADWRELRATGAVTERHHDADEAV